MPPRFDDVLSVGLGYGSQKVHWLRKFRRAVLDIVVIGAGLSGLTAAATLREAGASVQVIEAGTLIGGRIHALRNPQITTLWRT